MTANGWSWKLKNSTGIVTLSADSGAAYSVINRKLLDRISAKPSNLTVTLAPLGKETITAQTLTITHFHVGAKIQKEVVIPIVDFTRGFNVDGLLGMNFLGNYRFTLEPDTATPVLREKPIRK